MTISDRLQSTHFAPRRIAGAAIVIVANLAAAAALVAGAGGAHTRLACAIPWLKLALGLA